MNKMDRINPENRRLVRQHEAELREKYGQDILAFLPGFGVINHAPSREDLALALKRDNYDFYVNVIYMATIDEVLRA